VGSPGRRSRGVEPRIRFFCHISDTLKSYLLVAKYFLLMLVTGYWWLRYHRDEITENLMLHNVRISTVASEIIKRNLYEEVKQIVE
jgi:hypothetical protein